MGAFPSALSWMVPSGATTRTSAASNVFMPAAGSAGVVPGGFPANVGPFQSSLNLAAPGGTAGAAQSPFSFLQNMSPDDLSSLRDNLNDTFGEGMGGLMFNFMMSGAGFNQQVISNLLASLQPGIERGEQDIMEQFSAMGTRFGSPAATGLGDFLSRVNLNEGQIISQMFEDSLDRFMKVMMGVGGDIAAVQQAQPSIWDTISGALGLGGRAAQGLLAAGVGGGSGTLSSILSGIAGAGALSRGGGGGGGGG